ncbi:MAG TPA: hypothetical protein PLF18_09455 [Anaerolineales bacterium]|nr:hypothetical protein [Anaerolineales bacterium]HNH04960.1 hypothetical protein [Anaerolineales bacterium]
MAKNKNFEPSDAEDYLSQVKWKSDHAYRRTPWYLMPKWKYKPVSPYQNERLDPAFQQGFALILFLIPVGFSVYLLFSGYFWQAFAILAFTSFVGAILFLAIRDAQKKLKDKDD